MTGESVRPDPERPARDGSPATEQSLARELLTAWLHLTVLWAFAIAKPLFDILADEPEFFVARGNTSGDIVALAVALTLVPPTALMLCEALLFPFRSARRTLHLVFVAVLLAAIALQVIDGWVGAPGGALIAVSVALGVAGAIVYARTRIMPGMLSVLGPAPAVFLVIFLFFSPVSKLVSPESEDVAASPDVRSSTPVVLVVFDEFSGTSLSDGRGAIDADRFPHLAAFSRDATWYRNATTVAETTPRAVPAILTGSRPGKGALPIASEYPQNLFTLLGERYELNVSEPATDLCPESLCEREPSSRKERLRALFDDVSVVGEHMLLPEDLEDGLPAVNRTFGDFRAAGRDAETPTVQDAQAIAASSLQNRVGQFESFLQGVRGDTVRPQLSFLHLALPHVPWQYLPSGRSYQVSGPDPVGMSSDGTWTTQAWLPRQAYQRYLLQLGFVDRLLGRLLARLREQGMYDRSLIVVAADHGVSFRAGRNLRAVEAPNMVQAADPVDIASIPLLVKAPGQRAGRVDERPARTIDILPTIAAALDIRLPDQVGGRPLQERRPAEEAVKVVSALTGKEVHVSFTEFVRRRDAEVQRRVAFFGARDGFAGVYATGPYPNLLGASPRQLATGGRAAFGVEFDMWREYSSVTPNGRTVPAFVSGRLTGSARGDEAVAVAVNDRIVAVTRSYRDGAGVGMAAMVPPSAFRPGANEVEAFAVTGSGASTRLASAARVESPEASLAPVAGALVIKRPRGEPIPVGPGAADGFIQLAQRDSRGLTVTGWATDAAHQRPAEEVLVFADGRLLHSGPPSVPRPDVGKVFGTGVVGAGYQFSGLNASRASVAPGHLRVFAVVGGRASELRPLNAGIFVGGS